MKKEHIAAIAVAAGSFAGGSALAVLSDVIFRKTVKRQSAGAGHTHYGKSPDDGGSRDYKAESRRWARASQRAAQDSTEEMNVLVEQLKTLGRKWFYNQKTEHVFINATAEDVTLHGYYYHAEKPERIILMAHGHRGDPGDMGIMAKWLGENGCDMLLVNERGCGMSGGEYITYGVLEQLDMLDWLSWIHDHNYAGLPVYMMGTSLGAATVLMTTQYELAPEVKGVIADSAYTSMREVISGIIKQKVPVLPVNILMELLEDRCRSEAGFDPEEANTGRALAECKTPVLFVHGTGDKIVPVENMERNYAACACEDKRMLRVEGAGHVQSWYIAGDKYKQALTEFFEAHDADAADGNMAE